MKTNATANSDQHSAASKSRAIKKSKKPAIAPSDIYNIDKDKVMVNGIEVDIEKITDEQLYSLRKILPRKDYR